MNFLDLPPEILLHIVGYLDLISRHHLRCVNRGANNLVNEPSLWKDACVKLKFVDPKNKPFWKTLQARQIRYLHIVGCPKLTPKHYEVVLKYLQSSLICLEAECSFLHMNRHVLKQLCIGNLEELVLHCFHSMLPCDECQATNLKNFPKLRKLVLYKVTNAYIHHLSKQLLHISLPCLKVLHIGTSVINALCAKGELAVALSKQKALQELCFPEYTMVMESFFTTFAKSGNNSCTLSSFTLLGLCDFEPLQQMLLSMKNSLCKLSICVNAESASTVMMALSQLSNLTELGLKFVMVPTQPDFYHLGSLPNSLSSLSLAFEINHTPIEIPSGQKLFHSGSKWFPEAVLPALPQRLKGKLRELWLASVRLSTEDLNVMRQYTKLNTLTCRFMDNTPYSDLLKISQAPRLCQLRLHSVGVGDNLRCLKRLLSAESKGRVQVFKCTQNLLNLPSYIPQHHNRDVHFTPV